MKDEEQCKWVQEEEDGDTWATDCGNFFTLNEGPPSENLMVYCCYCGGELKEVPYSEDEDADEE